MTMPDDGKLVLIVHAVDAEGPLYESIDASFARLEEIYGITGLPRDRRTFDALCRGELDLGGLEGAVRELLTGHARSYHGDWSAIDAMLDELDGAAFRLALPDSFGGGWVCNWHCIDWVGFDTNPRRRAMGHHTVHDHYAARLANLGGRWGDAIHFHYHPISTHREAHRCASSFTNSATELHQVLCRKIIERRWFPRVHRAGCQTERPDSHLFLEQWVPFDISNMALDDPAELETMVDFRNGRSGDWRGAPADWSLYHPHHDDWRRPGQCRRVIGRALNVLCRVAAIDQREMDKAFARADGGVPTVVGIASHDWRDLRREIDHVRGLLRVASARHPGVRFQYCEGVEGFRRALGMTPRQVADDALELDVALVTDAPGDVPHLRVDTRRGAVFGPQPYLAIETRSRRFYHDNWDFGAQPGQWFYGFYSDTLELEEVRRIGIAANDRYGNQYLRVIELP